ncbi:MAG: hypothetical protein LBH03_04180 [Holophagales bacterium]|jgi:hypothetical protein|nr:hypothetical protein [Holophagales bacterium]
MNTFETSSTMEELQKIKEECSLRYLSQTPEERRLESERAIKRAETAMGRKIPVVDNSRLAREAAKEELTQV